MDDQKRADDQERLEEHSLPGTNQAGKSAPECGERDADNGSARNTTSSGSAKQVRQVPERDARGRE